jgi:hypothetical protein
MRWIGHPAGATMLYRTAAFARREREDKQTYEGAQLQLRRCKPLVCHPEEGFRDCVTTKIEVSLWNNFPKNDQTSREAAGWV